MRLKRSAVVVCALALCGAHLLVPDSTRARAGDATRVNVRLVTDEAEAVLAVLSKRRAGQAITDDDWRRIFTSELARLV